MKAWLEGIAVRYGGPGVLGFDGKRIGGNGDWEEGKEEVLGGMGEDGDVDGNWDSINAHWQQSSPLACFKFGYGNLF